MLGISFNIQKHVGCRECAGGRFCVAYLPFLYRPHFRGMPSILEAITHSQVIVNVSSYWHTIQTHPSAEN